MYLSKKLGSKKLCALTLAAGLMLPTYGCDSAADSDGEGGEGGETSTGGKGSGGSSSGGSATGGIGGGGGDTSAPAAEWAGVEAHLDMAGNVGEAEVRLEPSGDDAADLGTVYCERNYIVPNLEDTSAWAEDGYLLKIEVKFNFFYEGKLAEFQIELEKENLFESVGETLDVGDGVGVSLGLEADADGPDAEEWEDEAVSGTVQLQLLSGEVSEDGLTIPDNTGAFGAYVDVTLASGGTFRGTFTANCGENDYEVPE